MDAASGRASASSSARTAALPRLHLITDAAVLAAPDFVERATALLRAGRHRVALHLRAPSLPARPLFAAAARLVDVAGEAGARLLVNERADVARGSGAHGVQAGAHALPLPELRRLLGAEALLGASVHSEEEAAAAVAGGADFLIAGTLFPTPSHPGRAGAGVAWLPRLARTGLPVIGIGGITPARARTVRAAGGHGVAVLRGVWQAPRPEAALEDFLAALEEGDESD